MPRPPRSARWWKSQGSGEWLTPKWLLDRLGSFDLDPCASVVRPWPTAAKHLTIRQDGLSKPWKGRVWLNPPYGRKAGRWLERMAAHRDGIALLFARTETEMFHHHVWPHASAALFLRGRISFCKPDGTIKGNAGGPSVLVAYDKTVGFNAASLRDSGIPGVLLRVNTAWITQGRCTRIRR